MPPVEKYRFDATYSGDRPTEGTAKRAEIRITDPDSRVSTLRLTSAELRRLQRASLQGLGYTKVPRDSGQWDSTWKDEIDQIIEPVLVVTKAVLPVEKRRKP